jgi:hypothetical protein
MYHQYPDSFFQSLVPGSTAGSSSQGTLNYAAGFPAPVTFAQNVPPSTAAQLTQPVTLEQALLDMQLQQGAIAVQNKAYTQGYLKTLIGKTIRVEFLIGEASFQDRIGVLLEVGVDYIVLREIETDDNLFCDAFSIKFVMEYR